MNRKEKRIAARIADRRAQKREAQRLLDAFGIKVSLGGISASKESAQMTERTPPIDPGTPGPDLTDTVVPFAPRLPAAAQADSDPLAAVLRALTDVARISQALAAALAPIGSALDNQANQITLLNGAVASIVARQDRILAVIDDIAARLSIAALREDDPS